MTTTDNIIEEYKKCLSSPYYFCTKYIRVRNHKGKYAPYQTVLTEEQFNDYCKNLLKIKE